MRIKITEKITEIEANAEELRQSSSLSDGLTSLLRNAFNPYRSFNLCSCDEMENDTDEENEQ